MERDSEMRDSGVWADWDGWADREETLGWCLSGGISLLERCMERDEEGESGLKDGRAWADWDGRLDREERACVVGFLC